MAPTFAEAGRSPPGRQEPVLCWMTNIDDIDKAKGKNSNWQRGRQFNHNRSAVDAGGWLTRLPAVATWVLQILRASNYVECN